jgi:tetratricopeptide (TPR) repeat protein
MDRALELAGLRPAEAVPLLAPLLDLPVPPGRYPATLLSPEQQRRRLIATLAEWVAAVARLQPAVIVIEDLHWIDPSTLDVLSVLVEQGATEPLLLLFTARPEFRTPWPPRAHHAQIALARLSAPQVREMIGAVTARSVPAEAAVERLIERTDGIPLFVEELTRAVVEGAVIEQQVPASLQESLAARLDRLGSAKEVAQVAAVIGREFSLGVLHAVLPMPEADLRAALTRLVAADLVYVRGMGSNATCFFRHALLRDAAYASVLTRRRRDLHRSIAAALIARFPSLADAEPEVLAQHWTEAHEAEKAIAAWQQAGDRARQRSAFVEGTAHYTRALEVLATAPESPERVQQELTLQLSLSYVLDFSRGLACPEKRQALARARALGKRIENPQQLFWVLLSMWASPLAAGEVAAADDLSTQILNLAERDGSDAVLAWGHYARAQSLYNRGDLASAAHHYEDAGRFYKEADHAWMPMDPGILVYGNGALTFCQTGQIEKVREWHGTALALAERLDRPLCTAQAITSVAAGEVLLHEPEPVLARAEQMFALGTELQSPLHVALSKVFGGWARAVLDNPSQGIAQLRDGMAQFVACSNRTALASYMGLLAEAQWLAGAPADGLATIEEALLAVPDERVYIPELLRLRGDLLAAAGAEPARAESSYQEAIELARQLGVALVERLAVRGLERLRRPQSAVRGVS